MSEINDTIDAVIFASLLAVLLRKGVLSRQDVSDIAATADAMLARSVPAVPEQSQLDASQLVQARVVSFTTAALETLPGR